MEWQWKQAFIIIIIIIINGHKKKLVVQLEIHQAALNRFTDKLPWPFQDLNHKSSVQLLV